jgi:hypothetical protein
MLSIVAMISIAGWIRFSLEIPPAFAVAPISSS